MVLAATATEDRDGGAAAGLGAPLAARLRERMAALEAMDRAARRSAVRRVASGLTAIPKDAALPPRAAAILAADRPRADRERAARHAPEVRRGFRVSAGLKATLRRLAAPGDPRAAESEREAARRALELDPGAEAALRRWTDRLSGAGDEDRVRGALLLGMTEPGGGDATSRPWRRIGEELAEACAIRSEREWRA
jgi:hypothetical protein